jgi:hypothetical protein
VCRHARCRIGALGGSLVGGAVALDSVALDSVDFVLIGKTREGYLVLRRRLPPLGRKCQCPGSMTMPGRV